MIERHALVDITGNVVDIIFIDPSGAQGVWPIPKGYQLVDTAGAPVNPNDTWDGKQFSCNALIALCIPPDLVAMEAAPLPAINLILAAEAAAQAAPAPAVELPPTPAV